MEQKWRESRVSPWGWKWTTGQKMTTFRETGQAGVEETVQGSEETRSPALLCGCLEHVHVPPWAGAKDETAESVVSASVSPYPLTARPSPSPLLVPSPLSIGKNSKWQGDQELGPYPLFFSILIHFQSLAVNTIYVLLLLLLLLLSHFSRVWLCATPQTAAHQASPSLGFSRQEHWSGLPFPSPTHESEKWKWSRSVLSDSEWPHGLQPTGLLRPWDFSRQEYWSGVPSPSPIYVLMTPKFKSPPGPLSLTVDTSNYLLNISSQHIISIWELTYGHNEVPYLTPKPCFSCIFLISVNVSFHLTAVPNPSNSHLLCSPDFTHHHLLPGSLQWSSHCCPYPSLAFCPHNSKVLLEYKSLLSLLY